MSIVKARKEHRCTLCFLPIPKGERYERATITPWDHPDNEAFFEYKVHEECNTLWGRNGDAWDWMFPRNKSDWVELVGPEMAVICEKPKGERDIGKA